ncbi:hypothetical protein KKD70_00595 [Patescibacteria group bacterium]|nr:hypothetical protein [Patescibacteria group bacterium]
MALDPYTIIGFIGALVIMVGFIMNQLGRWKTYDFEYDFINLIGASILAVYSWQIGSYPLLLMFSVWTVFSGKDVLVDFFKQIFGKKTKENGVENKAEKKNEDITNEKTVVNEKTLEKDLEKRHDVAGDENVTD